MNDINRLLTKGQSSMGLWFHGTLAFAEFVKGLPHGMNPMIVHDSLSLGDGVSVLYGIVPDVVRVEHGVAVSYGPVTTGMAIKAGSHDPEAYAMERRMELTKNQVFRLSSALPDPTENYPFSHRLLGYVVSLYSNYDQTQWHHRVLAVELHEMEDRHVIHFYGGPTGSESYALKEDFLCDVLGKDHATGTRMWLCAGTKGSWPACTIDYADFQTMVRKAAEAAGISNLP